MYAGYMDLHQKTNERRGVRRRRSTTDCVFTLQHLIEKGVQFGD